MTRYLLDTDALIDFSKGAEPATSAILRWIDSGDVVGVCPITVGEFFSGLSPSQAGRWDPFVSALMYWGISRQSAVAAGQQRHTFARKGRALTIADALIAATAMENEAVLVTGNVKDFPMENLVLYALR